MEAWWLWLWWRGSVSRALEAFLERLKRFLNIWKRCYSVGSVSQAFEAFFERWKRLDLLFDRWERFLSVGSVS